MGIIGKYDVRQLSMVPTVAVQFVNSYTESRTCYPQYAVLTRPVRADEKAQVVALCETIEHAAGIAANLTLAEMLLKQEDRES